MAGSELYGTGPETITVTGIGTLSPDELVLCQLFLSLVHFKIVIVGNWPLLPRVVVASVLRWIAP
jgi:hypothetical protein